MPGLGAGSTWCPPPRRKGRFVFPNLTSGARCAGRDGKAAEPVHAGPPGVRKHLTAEPCNGRLAAWAAGGNGREFRSPLEPGSAGRGRVPSRLMSLGTQVHGRPAAGLPAQGSPGRGKVPSRLLSPKPKSMASWQHGLPAGTAANSEAPWSKKPRARKGSVETHVSQCEYVSSDRPFQNITTNITACYRR